MSSTFGGGGPYGSRRHPERELQAANQRARLRLARDINDQRTLAQAAEAPIRRTNHWLWLAVAVVVAGFLALAGGRDEDVPLTADCAHPAIAVASSEVSAGTPLRYRLTGADGVRYVVTLDGEPVQGDAGSTVTYTNTPAGPALELQQCLSPTLVLAAPARDGAHELALLRLHDDGTATQLTAVRITITSGR